ncbi:hypothetical protein RhiirA5_427540 [Rhizophagus irregularis]|uniref:Uncharacterized protein n=2 Tax=Rhizophagus irregularis TaxID=588596 RepID=A0A2N0P279_9GLOM|nr:hypothetical protein RhiirA5_427540 [Rhizophagus irregularis]
MEPSVPLVKFIKNPLYQEFRYIEGKLIIRYDNLLQTSIPIYRGFTYDPLYRDSENLRIPLSALVSTNIGSGGTKVKDRKERDRWQLTRDLIIKEMEECKSNEYEFVKNVVNKEPSTGKFDKILKISKKWKVIAYFKDGIGGGTIDRTRELETKKDDKRIKVRVDETLLAGYATTKSFLRIGWHKKEKKQEIELIPYQRYVAPPILSSEKVIGKTVSPKYEELTNVFRKCGEEMEWEATEMQITEKFEGVREWVTEKEWTNII